MDASLQKRLSIAQTLPVDVLCDLYFTVASSDPPARKHAFPPYLVQSISPFRKNAAKEPLGPTWSQIPAVGTRRNDYISSTSYMADEESLGWILLTHVCSQWRSVGLSLSSLWGDIFSIFPKVASTLLSRARDAPLTFDMDFLSHLQPNPFGSRDYLSSFKNLARQHLARAGTMTFAQHAQSDWNITLLYHNEFPYLKDLRVQVLYVPIMHPTFERPPRLAPSLKRLVLNVFIPFTAPNLTNLELSNLQESKSAEVLTLLSSSPLLEELLLTWTKAAQGTTTPSMRHFGNVHLPRLTTARFGGISSALAFSRKLNIPSHAELGFVAHSPLDIPSLMDVVSPRLSDSGINCFSLSISWDADVFAASVHEPGTKTSPRTFITAYEAELSLEDRLALFHEIIIRATPNRIVSLYVDPYPYMDMGPLENTVITVLNGLRALSALTSLSMACVPMARDWPFLEALRGSINPDLPTFAPALQTLIIYSDDTLRDKGFTKTEVECVQHRWDRIISILEHRREIGLPLRRLVLEGARGDDPEIASINASGSARAAVFVDEVIDNRRDHALTGFQS
ncbi:hypothetical protein PENSPDRAFT_297898 [Peniophora sp. CONT]|nr:hypothetical protein PENSPDRAFT_297898 [Peniophora sp. CONT]